MDNALILQNIERHIDLEKAEQEVFVGMLQPQQLPRKSFFLKENEICRHSVFVTAGCLRGFTVDHNGFEHVLQFAPADWWIADMYSLVTEKPGQLNIEALEDSQVLLLSKTDQERLYREVPKFERFFRIIAENSLVSIRQRLVDNLSLSAQQRYEQFCQQYPTLINRLPQKQIAAYIGVTPEFLSTIRARSRKKK